jgi:hypothetical protein
VPTSINFPALGSISTFLVPWICAAHKSITEKGHFHSPTTDFEKALSHGPGRIDSRFHFSYNRTAIRSTDGRGKWVARHQETDAGHPEE